MPATQPLGMDAIADLVLSEPGLIANVSNADIRDGADAAILMNGVIGQAITATGVNSDGKITAGDLEKVSDYIRSNPSLYRNFVEGHGNDEGNEETGFHLVQGDGGALEFQGRDFIDTIADAIYHIGFEYRDGRFRNEDGNANEQVIDVAGWLNYFVNGENRVYGTGSSDQLSSGDYSFALADAAHEIFSAGAGNDTIWAGLGDDTVFGGNGADRAGGGDGNDLMKGGSGNDTLGGDEGNDRLLGGSGDDKIWGDEGRDRLMGGKGNDSIVGGEGKDRLIGNKGNDTMYGSEGSDSMSGGSGDDRMGGGVGKDVLRGGSDDDKLAGDKGKDSLYGDTGMDTLYGGTGNDKLWGGKHGDNLHGQDGNDTLNGGSGRDELSGDDGKDHLFGGNGNDTLSGGEGRDRITGGKGVDEIKDYEDYDSRDVFIFATGHTGVGAGNRDVIKGFDSGIDRLDLRGFGDLELKFGSTFSGNGQGQVLFDNGVVRIDRDGNGTADAEIELSWVNAVAGEDFIL